MSESDEEFVLLIGSTNSESTTSRLRAGGSFYIRKLLNSRPENWESIVEILEHTEIKCVLAALNAYDYSKLVNDEYSDVANKLLTALASVPHIVFIHDAVYFQYGEHSPFPDGGDDPADYARPEPIPEYGDYVADLEGSSPFGDGSDFIATADLFAPADSFFGSISDEVRVEVNAKLREHSIHVVPYKRNVERSVLAARFLDDTEKQLLFRVYVPSGRLYADEADTMLRLFADWLRKTGRESVRQDGYNTSGGQVFQFFGSKKQKPGELSQQFKDFSAFLDACVDEPSAAVAGLEAVGIGNVAANSMVARYARETRRLELDLGYARDTRVRDIRHLLESELIDEPSVSPAALNQLVEELVPTPTAIAEIISPQAVPATRNDAATVQIILNNAQFNSNITGTVVQNLDGTVNLGTDARVILDLIRAHPDLCDDDDYEGALHELEDEDAAMPDRVTARAKLKRLMGRLSDEVPGLVLGTAQRYIEAKLGL